MVTVQVHPGAGFHLHQPGSVVSGAPAASAVSPHVVRDCDGTLFWDYANDPGCQASLTARARPGPPALPWSAPPAAPALAWAGNSAVETW
eukprot:7872738-Alexandrium_andersonii.AAC.1